MTLRAIEGGAPTIPCQAPLSVDDRLDGLTLDLGLIRSQLDRQDEAIARLEANVAFALAGIRDISAALHTLLERRGR
jgi:hypothetical protein